MALINRKISTYAKDVSNLSNTPNDDGMTAAELKAIFMGAAKEEIKTSVNGIVDDLVATTDGASGADQIGMTAIDGLDGNTPQSIIESLNLKALKTDFINNLTAMEEASLDDYIPISDTTEPNAAKKILINDFITLLAESMISNSYLIGDYEVPLSDVLAALSVTEVDTISSAIGKLQRVAIDLSVHKAGDETITGIKTFDVSPNVPLPEADSNAAPKKYVDAHADMLKSTYDTNDSGVVDNAEKVNGLTVETAVPLGAVFTDTTYSEATQSADGLMSSEDKTKLDEISGTNTGDETVNSIGTLINSADAKTTPADNDMLALMDSAASNVAKKLSWANIKTALANIFASKAGLDSDGKVVAAQLTSKITEITADTTLVLTHNGKCITSTSGSAVNVTIPLNASVAFPTDTEIEILQYGAGTVAFVATTGVTINCSETTYVISAQYKSAFLKKLATDIWLLQLG